MKFCQVNAYFSVAVLHLFNSSYTKISKHNAEISAEKQFLTECVATS